MDRIQTSTFGFYKMDFEEIKELETEDEIAICIKMDLPSKVEFIKAKVVRPLFWNSDADEPDWELETNNGFVDTHSIWGVTSSRPFNMSEEDTDKCTTNANQEVFSVKPEETYFFYTTDSNLKKYNGTKVTVIRQLTADECDIPDVGNMYRIRFEDGYERDAFENELVKGA